MHSETDAAQQLTSPATPDQPLAGKHIAITRPPEQVRRPRRTACEPWRARHAVARHCHRPRRRPSRLDAAIAALAGYDWIVFTSANGVRAFEQRLSALGLDWSTRRRARIAAIGPATATSLEQYGVSADLVPPEYVAEGLVEALGNVAGQRILLPRADIAREALARELELRGAQAHEIAAYRTVVRPLDPALLSRVLDADRVDAITFTSSSTVRSLLEALRAAGRDPTRELAGIVLACIGPITAQTLREAGLEPGLVAEVYTVAGLVTALVAHFSA